MAASHQISPVNKEFEAVSRGFTRLILANFRNYRQLTLAMDRRPVVLVGANGAGKTNLLEALSLFAPGRGLRRALLSEIGRREGDMHQPWSAGVRLCDEHGDTELGTGVLEDHSERRMVRSNGEPLSSANQFGDYLAMAWLTPAMDRIFMDGASARRRFLDRLVLTLHPGHGRQVNAYEQAMRERNALLDSQARPDPQWASAIESRMVEHGVAIAAARREAVVSLGALIKAMPESCFPKAGLAMTGLLENWLEQKSALESEDAFAALLRDNRGRDAAAGRTLEGPHKSDLDVTHEAKDMPAAQSSTGEQKALLIGLMLAHAKLVEDRQGKPPILLLDEVAAHLDEARRDALGAALAALPAQAWMSGTDARLFEGLKRGKAQFFKVHHGQVEVLDS